jgi:hypothetical protein
MTVDIACSITVVPSLAEKSATAPPGLRDAASDCVVAIENAKYFIISVGQFPTISISLNLFKPVVIKPPRNEFLI